VAVENPVVAGSDPELNGAGEGEREACGWGE